MASFYDTHRDYGLMPEALPPISILLLIVIIGIIFNTLIIIITCFSK